MQPLQYILAALFPTTCVACGQVLAAGERQLCLDCLSHLNTNPSLFLPGNPTEKLLLGQIDYHAAGSLSVFSKGNTIQAVVHAMKFHSCTELCHMMGRQMGLAIAKSNRFDDIDLLIPVPLHWTRQLSRGYNQSTLLCKGIAEIIQKPVAERLLIRRRPTRKQSLQRVEQRRENVYDAFRCKHPGHLENKHLLIVDDVVTTGATLAACASALKGIEGLRISLASFCIAR